MKDMIECNPTLVKISQSQDLRERVLTGGEPGSQHWLVKVTTLSPQHVSNPNRPSVSSQQYSVKAKVCILQVEETWRPGEEYLHNTARI